MVESAREIDGRIERETASSSPRSPGSPAELGPVIRGHWAIENSLHWVMDMVFRDDGCRIRTDHAPANFTTLKHMAHNMIRKAPGKDLIRLKRKAGRLERRLPRKPPRRINPSPDSPGWTDSSASASPVQGADPVRLSRGRVRARLMGRCAEPCTSARPQIR